MSLYPLKFKPRYLEKMWGGRKIETVLGKSLPAAKPIGESWELFDFPPGVVDESPDWFSSEIINGRLAGSTLHELVQEFGRDLYGTLPMLGVDRQFPILIKFLDAAQDLSVQVHPDKQYAATHPEAHLKCEAWYIVQSDPGSRLLKGLKKGVTKNSFARAIAAGDVNSVVKTVPVSPGQCYYLPSGTVHALGAGILAAEVQTPSDTTFRVFDFNRIDPSTGKPRKLHVDQALQCIDFSGSPEMPPSTQGIASEYFNINIAHFSPNIGQSLPGPRPAVWMIVQGQAQISVAGQRPTEMSRGDTVLLPAALENPVFSALEPTTVLQVTFPSVR